MSDIKPSQPKSIQAILSKMNPSKTNADDTLYNIVQHAGLLQSISALVDDWLPENLKKHCQLANYRDGRLILFVDSPAYATLLRMKSPQLAQAMTQKLKLDHNDIKIQIKVKPQ